MEDTLSYHPKCFVGDLKNVEGIIDCTEQHFEKPSNAKLQYQTYSTYKSANTQKMIVCTKAGSISYISDGYGGSASDRFITEDCNVVTKYHRGMVALNNMFCSKQTSTSLRTKFIKTLSLHVDLFIT